jgi:hypothetical protein
MPKMATNLTVAAPNQLRTMSKAELLARLQGTVDMSASSNANFLRFDGRMGRYAYGTGDDELDLPKGTKVLLNLFESKQGYACWKENKPVDSVDVSLFDALPPVDSLTDHGPYSDDKNKREGWSKQYTLFLRTLPDADGKGGKQFILKLSAESARREFERLLAEVMDQTSMHDIQEQTPVIALGAQSFEWGGYKNFKPRFEIADWLDNPAQPEPVAAVTAEEETSKERAAISASRKK